MTWWKTVLQDITPSPWTSSEPPQTPSDGRRKRKLVELCEQLLASAKLSDDETDFVHQCLDMGDDWEASLGEDGLRQLRFMGMEHLGWDNDLWHK